MVSLAPQNFFSQQSHSSHPPNQLFVGGLPKKATNKLLYEFFSKFGKVADARIVLTKDTKESRGFAFITFCRADTLEKVLKKKEYTFLKTKVSVKGAMSKETNDIIQNDEKERKIFVVGLPYKISVDQIRAYFTHFGEIDKIDHISKKGFAFVLFKSRTSVFNVFNLEADHKINNTIVECRPVVKKEELQKYNLYSQNKKCPNNLPSSNISTKGEVKKQGRGRDKANLNKLVHTLENKDYQNLETIENSESSEKIGVEFQFSGKKIDPIKKFSKPDDTDSVLSGRERASTRSLKLGLKKSKKLPAFDRLEQEERKTLKYIFDDQDDEGDIGDELPPSDPKNFHFPSNHPQTPQPINIQHSYRMKQGPHIRRNSISNCLMEGESLYSDDWQTFKQPHGGLSSRQHWRPELFEANPSFGADSHGAPKEKHVRSLSRKSSQYAKGIHNYQPPSFKMGPGGQVVLEDKEGEDKETPPPGPGSKNPSPNNL